MKYFGQFTSRDDVAREFEYGNWSGAGYKAEPFVPAEGFPSEDEMLFASYETPRYEGSALVLFERGGKLFEVNGSHCSCYGLEGQWEPEETLWKAIDMKRFSTEQQSSEAIIALGALVAEHVK
jgi:hypothetical protein